MYTFEDNLWETYKIDEDTFDLAFDYARELLDSDVSHLWNAAMHLYFEWRDTPSEKRNYAAKEMLDRIRELMIPALKGDLKKRVKSDKWWYAMLMCSEDVE